MPRLIQTDTMALIGVALVIIMLNISNMYVAKNEGSPANTEGLLYHVELREVNGSVVPVVLLNMDPDMFGNYAREGFMRPAKRVEARGADAALKRAGVEGRVLGTYRFNGTHVVTLVERGSDVWAVVWNNETVDKFALKFEKYVDRSGRRVVRVVHTQSAVFTWRFEGYTAVDSPLPFDVYLVYEHASSRWDLSSGYYEVTAVGRFYIVYGAGVYVDNSSYYRVTEPVLTSCFFRSWVDGNGGYSASIKALGRATTPMCKVALQAEIFELHVYVGWDVWMNREAIAGGDKWLMMSCNC